MMQVLYDNQIFKIQKYGGISRYFSELFSGAKAGEFIAYPKKYFSENKHLRLNNLTHYNGFADSRNFRGKLRIENYLKSKEDATIVNLLKKGKYGVFHPTYYDPYFLDYIAEKPFVLTVHDMIHELYYDPYYGQIHFETKSKRTLIPKASHIISVSQNTKNDIIRLYPEIDESKISVIYHGSSLPAINRSRYATLSDNYLLFVGHRGLYKNFTWFLNAMKDYLNAGNLSIICAGGPPFIEEEQSLIAALNLGSRVYHRTIENDAQLVALYRGARCFVFPSLYEGFGIPILEAFSCGCPVILANCSCFPEIGGDAALYFDTDKPESLVEQVSKVVENEALSRSLKEAGFEHLKLFSWNETVKKHIKIYQSLINV